MNMKEHILSALMEEFDGWEALIRNLSESRRTAALSPSSWTAKDVLVHLRAWQLRSIARLEAAQKGTEPDFPLWIPALDPDADTNIDMTNAWLYETYRQELWPKVYKDWREGYLRFVELGESFEERGLLDSGRYLWLAGQPLAVVLLASYDHHQEHLEKLTTWFKEHSDR